MKNGSKRGSLAEAPLPLDRLRAAFQLEATEQRCLWLLLAHAASSEVRAASGHPDGLPLELLDAIAYGAPGLRERFAAELGPGGRLLRYGLVELDGAGPRLGRRARIADRIVELALGVDALADDVAAFAALLPAPAERAPRRRRAAARRAAPRSLATPSTAQVRSPSCAAPPAPASAR